MKKQNKFPRYIIAALVLLSAALHSGCPADRPDLPEKEVSLAASHEFVVQDEGLSSLEETYEFQFDIVYEMAIGFTHEALRRGDVDAAIGFATDGKIMEVDLYRLEDDRGAFPARNPAPVVRSEILDRYPQIEDIMAGITPLLDNIAMIELNYLVDFEEREPSDVAREWLLEKELISDRVQEGGGDKPVKVSSKEFTEQQILRQITILALQDAGIPVQDEGHVVGTENIRLDLDYNNIDLYWEYTGVAWNRIFEEDEIITDSERVYRLVAERDAEEGLIWLDYAPMNKTYIILMLKEHAESLEINTISELAEWVKRAQAGEL